ncbi:MAG: peptide ABC transporter substrate-binding protein [Lachnospiraceae bacterium]|nr:peptide ABC transporter substrate-binding protein [Lachnospiraceae bacterium]
MKKKLLSLLLVSAMAVSVAACGNEPSGNNGTSGADSSTESTTEQQSSEGSVENSETDPGEEQQESATTIAEAIADMDYDTTSAYLYDLHLGEFWDVYQEALAEENVSLKYAKEAIAEAKLMEAAVMLPTRSRGGNYAISNIATRSLNTTLWGNDTDRLYSAIICEEPILASDQDALKAIWGESIGTGTYQEKAKAYLTEHGYTLKDTYNYGSYTSDAATWDVLATSKQADSEKVVHTYDGLLEYDCENVQRPALAESYEVSDDGLTWTFHIREGVKWVDSQGREVADVCADDWVAGMQHMMDAMGGLEYLVGADGAHIVNADAYINGEITDFSEVGVTAEDEHTLVYTLDSPAPYFDTMLGYGCFAPMSRTYYESQGGKFGAADYDPADPSYVYGTDPDHIAYCGPYLVTNFTAGSTIVYRANESYWNTDKVNIKTLTWKFNDGTDALKQYNGFMAGELDGCGLNANALEQAKLDGMFDDYHYVSATDATSFMGFLNINRGGFANFNDDSAVVSPQSEEDAARTKEAMNNIHFRRAFCFSVDRAAYNAQSVGEELKLNSVRNSYVPGSFVTLTEDVTVDINGTSKTYPAGTFYGQIMQDQIDADGFPVKVWDATELTGDGFDGWYNPDNAVAELNTAIEELAALGIVIDEQNPIYIDLPYPSNSEVYTNTANVVKQSVESVLGGKVIVNLTECVDYDQWYGTGYDTTYGYEANYDMYDLSGWGPDYGDPQTYLNTFAPEYAGYMIKCLGIY